MEINFEMFMADYNNAVNGRDALVAQKEAFVAEKKAKIDEICAAVGGLSDEGKEKLLKEILDENANAFDIDSANKKVDAFAKYIIFDVEESLEEAVKEETVNNEQNSAVAEGAENPEAVFPEQAF